MVFKIRKNDFSNIITCWMSKNTDIYEQNEYDFRVLQQKIQEEILVFSISYSDPDKKLTC